MLISQAEWARRHGFTRQYASRLVKRGVVRLVDGRIDPAEADAALAAVREPARPRRRRDGWEKSPVEHHVAGDSHDAPPVAPRPDPFGPPSGGDLPTLLLKTQIKSEVGRYHDADEVRIAAFNKGRGGRRPPGTAVRRDQDFRSRTLCPCRSSRRRRARSGGPAYSASMRCPGNQPSPPSAIGPRPATRLTAPDPAPAGHRQPRGIEVNTSREQCRRRALRHRDRFVDRARPG